MPARKNCATRLPVVPIAADHIVTPSVALPEARFDGGNSYWLGGWPQEEPCYRERSPLHHVDRLSKSVIFH